MHQISLADELADTRAEIVRLKQREATLRAAILERRGQVSPGRWHRVEVVERRSRVFDQKLLPTEVANNPAYLRERVTRYVKCLPVQVGGSRPGGTPSANTHPVGHETKRDH